LIALCPQSEIISTHKATQTTCLSSPPAPKFEFLKKNSEFKVHLLSNS
jgi:hypothetical protein